MFSLARGPPGYREGTGQYRNQLFWVILVIFNDFSGYIIIFCDVLSYLQLWKGYIIVKWFDWMFFLLSLLLLGYLFIYNAV